MRNWAGSLDRDRKRLAPPLGRRSSAIAALIAAGMGAAAGAEADGGVTVAVDASVCQALIEHVPAPDVAYQAGVDARGRSVPPADIAPPITLDALDRFEATFTVDLAQTYGLAAELLVPVADVTFRDGQLTVNGQPVGSADDRRIREACAKAPPLGRR